MSAMCLPNGRNRALMLTKRISSVDSDRGASTGNCPASVQPCIGKKRLKTVSKSAKRNRLPQPTVPRVRVCMCNIIVLRASTHETNKCSSHGHDCDCDSDVNNDSQMS